MLTPSVWPSSFLAQQRDIVPNFLKRASEDIEEIRGFSYSTRCLKSAAINGIKGATLLMQGPSALLISTGWLNASAPPAIARLQTVRCPFVKTPISTWAATAGMCLLVGPSGPPGQANDVQTYISCVAEIFDRPLSPAVIQLFSGVFIVFSFGVVGLGEIALNAHAQSFAEADKHTLAQCCLVGALILTSAVEFARVPLQVAIGVIELLPMLPLALCGVFVGTSMFILSPVEDRYGGFKPSPNQESGVGASRQALDEASEQALDGASEQALDGASEQALDGASEQALDGASEHALDGASEHALDGASEHALDGASEHALDGASERPLNEAAGQALDDAGISG